MYIAPKHIAKATRFKMTQFRTHVARRSKGATQ